MDSNSKRNSDDWYYENWNDIDKMFSQPLGSMPSKAEQDEARRKLKEFIENNSKD